MNLKFVRNPHTCSTFTSAYSALTWRSQRPAAHRRLFGGAGPSPNGTIERLARPGLHRRAAQGFGRYRDHACRVDRVHQLPSRDRDPIRTSAITS